MVNRADGNSLPDNHPNLTRYLNSLEDKLTPPSAIRLEQMDTLESPELLVLVVPTFLVGVVVVVFGALTT
jgi:hypothetical protein